MTGRWCRENSVVVVAVYTEERPARRRTRQGRHHHHHHRHQNENGRVNRGLNRRAELLDYARHLRLSSAHHQIEQRQPSTPVHQISNAGRKPKHSSPPTCFDKWECLLPRSFLRFMTTRNTTKDKGKKSRKDSVSTTTKTQALVKSLKVKKNGSFLSKLLTKLHKQR